MFITSLRLYHQTNRTYISGGIQTLLNITRLASFISTQETTGERIDYLFLILITPVVKADDRTNLSLLDVAMSKEVNISHELIV